MYEVHLKAIEARLPKDARRLWTDVCLRGILYDAFDSSETHSVHRFLFWPYHEISIQFRGFAINVTSAGERIDEPITP